MDITPKTEAIIALSHQNLKWETILSELVDNSLDAGASRVDLVFGPGKTVVVIDDGSGCKDIQAMVRIGDHRAHDTTMLGRYGIGLKDAAFFLKGTTEIDTICRKMRSRVAIDWNNVQEINGRWIVPDPKVEPVTASSGTTIRFSKFSRNLPMTDVQLEKLGFTFAPALLAGKQVRIIKKGKAKPCVAYQLPPLDDIVEAAFEVEGRGVRLRVGIVKDGIKNKYPGFTRQHGHRAMEATALGAGHYSTSRIAGIVELDGSWALTKNKDDITEYQEELGAAILAECEHILKRADTQSQQLQSSALNDAVSELLNEALQAAAKKRERREKPDESQPGTIEPKQSGKRRTRAAKTSDKDGAVERAARSGVRLDWSDSLEWLIGKADLVAGRVTLNSELPLLQSLRRDNQAGALAMLAFGIFVHAANSADAHRQKWLPSCESNDFVESWSKVVSKMPDTTNPKTKRRAS